LIHTTFLSAAFVKMFSPRSDWRKNAPILNSKCNPATPFPLDLQDTKTLFDEAWSSRVVSGQPAGASAAACAQACGRMFL